MQRHIIRCLLVLCLFGLSHFAFAFTTPPSGNKPVIVKVGVFVDDISAINESSQTATCELTITQMWQDKRLAFNPAQVGSQIKVFMNGAVQKELQTIWSPQVLLRHTRGKNIQNGSVLEINKDGQVTYIQRVIANIESHMDFRVFPFDQQGINIILRPFIYPNNVVKLEPLTGLQGFGRLAKTHSWHIVSAKIKLKNMKSSWNKLIYSQYSMHVKYKRKVAYYIFQLFMPLLLVVIFSFTVFWMMHNPLVNRVAISLTAVLTITVIQWRVFNELPHLLSHTFLHMFMLLSFVTAALTMVPCVVYDHIKTESHRERMVRIVRWAYPSAYILCLLVIILVFF